MARWSTTRALADGLRAAAVSYGASLQFAGNVGRIRRGRTTAPHVRYSSRGVFLEAMSTSSPETTASRQDIRSYDNRRPRADVLRRSARWTCRRQPGRHRRRPRAGWALDDVGGFARVEILVDGRCRHCVVGLSRPDSQPYFRMRQNRLGLLPLDTTRYGNGPHQSCPGHRQGRACHLLPGISIAVRMNSDGSRRRSAEAVAFRRAR